MARPKAYKLKGSFGSFKGKSVYYIGFEQRPKFLPENGRGFPGLKALLEALEARFGKFTVTFTPDTSSIAKDSGLTKVRISAKAIKAMAPRRWDANTRTNKMLADQLLFEQLPKYFTSPLPKHTYQRGMFVAILGDDLNKRALFPEDKTALTNFIADADIKGGAIDVGVAYTKARDVQLLYSKKLLQEFDKHLGKAHDEHWWQKYFSDHILYFQPSYIRKGEKLNIAIAGTMFPDFYVITADGYMDILEIKKPATLLLREDESRGNYYWSTEIAKAISQVENYIDTVTKHADSVRTELKDRYGVDLRIIKPRGIVIAGKAADFSKKIKMGDDFRRLNEGQKNVQIVPFDELSRGLHNTIEGIERLAASKQSKSKAARR